MADPFIGEIRIFAGNFAPQSWAFCDGSLQAISQNDTLFALIGTTYGGDGVQTFALPDLRGRVPIHQGQGPGLSSYVIGQVSGTENVTLINTQMPQHTHIASANSATGTAGTPANGFWAGTAAPTYNTTADAPMNPAATNSAGGNQPHENMHPFLTVTFIISLFGIFPSQN
ncbi:MAG: tail fiber protein [Acidobacteriota bacterium]